MKLIIAYLLYIIAIGSQPNINIIIGLFMFSFSLSLIAHYLRKWQLKKTIKEINNADWRSPHNKVTITVNLDDII